MAILSVNPYTEEVLGEYETLGVEESARRVEKAREAFLSWKKFPAARRAESFRALSRRLREGQRRYAETITREMGKPITQSLAEVEKCAWLCDDTAEKADRFLQAEPVETGVFRSYVALQPLGVILGIMPWNFPFWQVFRFAVPALAAGNVCVLKHASNVPATALALEALFLESGFPPHVFQTLLADSRTAMEIVERELVDAVSLTGSVEAGSQVASLAGRHIRKFVLELGGSDPFLVLENADAARAARMALQARMINSGQSCIAAKRFLVAASLSVPFRETLERELAAVKIGDPMDPATLLGPLARKEFLPALAGQLEDAERKGARVVRGPDPPPGRGFFFRPALVYEVRPDMRVMTEEVFGPVMPVLFVEKESEMVRLANATPYGLGASIWTRDLARGERLAAELEAGFVAVNDLVKSDPRLPFGGIKKSGVGRELSPYGIREFVNVKSVVVKEA